MMKNLGLKNKKIILETKNRLIIDLKNNKNGYLFSKNYTKFIDKQIKEHMVKHQSNRGFMGFVSFSFSLYVLIIHRG